MREKKKKQVTNHFQQEDTWEHVSEIIKICFFFFFLPLKLVAKSQLNFKLHLVYAIYTSSSSRRAANAVIRKLQLFFLFTFNEEQLTRNNTNKKNNLTTHLLPPQR